MRAMCSHAINAHSLKPQKDIRSSVKQRNKNKIMQTFISDIIPKIQRFSQKLDDLTILTNQHWVVIDEIEKSKNVYIFRSNNELLISSNGEVEKGRWEYLGNKSLLIDKKDKSYLFKHGFFDKNILALKIDGRNEYAFLVNENRFDGELNSINRVIDFLNKTYLDPNIQQTIEGKYEIKKSINVGKTREQIKIEMDEIQKFQDKNMLKFILLLVIIVGLFILFNYFSEN